MSGTERGPAVKGPAGPADADVAASAVAPTAAIGAIVSRAATIAAAPSAPALTPKAEAARRGGRGARCLLMDEGTPSFRNERARSSLFKGLRSTRLCAQSRRLARSCRFPHPGGRRFSGGDGGDERADAVADGGRTPQADQAERGHLRPMDPQPRTGVVHAPGAGHGDLLEPGQPHVLGE